MRANNYLFYLYLSTLVITVIPIKGYAMSLLLHPEQEIVISSPMEGTITYQGKAAAGARIERILKWKDETGQSDATIADEKGYFTLPVVVESAKLPKLSQFVAHQEIVVSYEGKDFTIWVMGKLGKTLYSELGGKPKNLRCELTDDLVRVESEDGLLGTVCKWDSVEEQGGH